MKKKDDASELVTKSFFKSELKRELDALKNEVGENAKQYRDEVLISIDGVMGELKVIREEITIGVHQVFELQEQASNHEGRIAHLEESKLPI